MPANQTKVGAPSRGGRSVQEVLAAMKAGEPLSPEEQAVIDSLNRAKARARAAAEGAAGSASLDEAVRRIVREEVEAILAERGLTGRSRR